MDHRSKSKSKARAKVKNLGSLPIGVDITKSLENFHLDKAAKITITISEGRVEDLCPYCRVYDHNLRKCPQFTQLKMHITRFPYIAKDGILHPRDVGGFCAAGIAPFCKSPDGQIMIMVLREQREHVEGFNFIGGRRESHARFLNGFVDLYSSRPENPLETAKQEFREELSPIIGSESQFIDQVFKATLRSCFWSGMSKYILYPILVPYDLSLSVQVISSIPDTSEAQGLAWVSLNIITEDLKTKTSRYPFHDYAWEMLKSLYVLTKHSLNVFFQ